MKIALFYHGKLGQTDIINQDYAWGLFRHQMALWHASELEHAVDYSEACFNDDEDQVSGARPFVPRGTIVIASGSAARSELPTMHRMQRWIKANPDSIVGYWHAKGVSHQGHLLTEAWRRCMEDKVIRNWKRCLADIATRDSVGTHWLTREQFGPMVDTFFWGGNFWWAKGQFLVNLPELPETSTCRDMDFLAEKWIGMGRRPVVLDYAPHWPSLHDCGQDRCFMLK